MMNGINPQNSSKAPAMDTGTSQQSAVQNLEQQKKYLQDELTRIKSDKNVNPEELKKKVEALEKQIKAIDTQIQKLKNNASQSDENKMQAAKPERFDEYVKEPEPEANAPDNVYRVEKEDGKQVVKFKREQFTE